MKCLYHPKVQEEVFEILDYYSAVSEALADGFYGELTQLVETAAEDPERFHSVSDRFRRVNLKRFPYHFLYEIHAGFIRVVVVKNNKRNPDYGTRRK